MEHFYSLLMGRGASLCFSKEYGGVKKGGLLNGWYSTWQINQADGTVATQTPVVSPANKLGSYCQTDISVTRSEQQVNRLSWVWILPNSPQVSGYSKSSEKIEERTRWTTLSNHMVKCFYIAPWKCVRQRQSCSPQATVCVCASLNVYLSNGRVRRLWHLGFRCHVLSKSVQPLAF